VQSVIIITQSYPYGHGESFLEEELRVLSEDNIKITVVPLKIHGAARPLPPSVELVSVSVSFSWFRALSSWPLLRVFLSELLLRPVSWHPSAFRLLLFFIKSAYVVRSKLQQYRESGNWPESPIIYSYWLGGLTYGAVLFRGQGYLPRVVSRAHGGDIYQERWYPRYLPALRFVFKKVDQVFVVSKDGAEYLKKRFPLAAKCIQVSYMGTRDPGFLAARSEDGVCRLVSCAFIVPVKRLEMLVNALILLRTTHPSFRFHWTHLGGGPGFDRLKSKCQTLITDGYCSLIGSISNAEVIEFYRNQPVDLFVSVSSSEGLPVSMMEAMSVGVPILATDVGGVSEIVQQEVGMLLSANVSITHLALTIINSSSITTNPAQIQKTWQRLFSSDSNGLLFASELRKLTID
jgi:glycosyltransferase involved in cell wall biosynthesis